MKTFLLFALISLNSFACLNPISIENADKAILLGVEKSEVSCKEGINCLCADGIALGISEIVDNIVVDYVSKISEVVCIKAEFNEAFPEANLFQDCDDKFVALSCGNESQKIKNYDLLQAYCAVPVMKIDGKKLQHNEVKKAAYELAKAEEAAKNEQLATKKKAAIEALKSVDIEGATTIAKLKAIVKLLMEAK